MRNSKGKGCVEVRKGWRTRGGNRRVCGSKEWHLRGAWEIFADRRFASLLKALPESDTE